MNDTSALPTRIRICLNVLACAGLCALLPARGFGAEIDFVHQIVPIFNKHCVACHGDKEAKGGFSLNTRALFLENEAAIPGNPDKSYFLELVTSPDPELQMPPFEKDRVSAQEIELLRQWVAQGLPWPEDWTFAKNTYVPPLLPQPVELPPAHQQRTHPIDRLLDQNLLAEGLPIPLPAADEIFLRRAYLDLTGLLPTPEEQGNFQLNISPDKRKDLVLELLDRKIAYADHWLTFWNDLLRNDYTGTGFITGGRKQISNWLYAALLENKSYQQMVRELVAPPTGESTGFMDGIKWRGEVSAGQTNAIQFSQSVSQSFLGINMKCASCHDSFIDRWMLKDAYGLAAIYSPEPVAIHRCDKPTGEMAVPGFMFPEIGQVDPAAPRDQRLQQLAALLTSKQNGRVTRTLANRIWKQLMGRGLVEPVDAMDTRPSHPELLEHLSNYLIEHNYDIKQLIAHIATSQAYQSQSAPPTSEAGKQQYRGPVPRRLTAEQFQDAIWQITGSAPLNFDAPIVRVSDAAKLTTGVDLTAKWIWGDSAKPGSTPPAGEQILLRKQFELDAVPERALAVMTCDNNAVLYLNGREVSQVKDWTRPVTVLLQPHLKKGKNEIIIRALNEGSSPNAAGFFFEARLIDSPEQITTLVSDETWQFNPEPNQPKEGRLGRVTNNWSAVTVVNALQVWSSKVDPLAREALALGIANEPQQMVRAALVNNNAFLTALGRPHRDQIVTSRPQELTTLEAIVLANGDQFSQSLAVGGNAWVNRFPDQPGLLIDELYQFVNTRKPTPTEKQLLLAELGPNPTPEQVQDLLWILCLSPEFFYIH